VVLLDGVGARPPIKAITKFLLAIIKNRAVARVNCLLCSMIRRSVTSSSYVKDIEAWPRLVALFAAALLALTTLGMALLIRGALQAKQVLRRVASHRRGRCELSLVAAAIAIVQKDSSLFAALSLQTKLNLEDNLSNVS
jgi:hypothetical protein